MRNVKTICRPWYIMQCYSYYPGYCKQELYYNDIRDITHSFPSTHLNGCLLNWKSVSSSSRIMFQETEKLDREKRTIIDTIKGQYCNQIADLESLIERLRTEMSQNERKYMNDSRNFVEQNDLVKREHEVAVETINQRSVPIHRPLIPK